MALGSGSLPASQALPLIMQAESGGQNKFNFAHASNPSYYTASGYYQITDSTWNANAASVPGASQYSRAIDAPEDVQTAVATQIYNTQGASPWSKYDAPLRASLQAAGDTSDLGSYVGPLGTGASTPDPSGTGPGSGGAFDYTNGQNGDAVASAAGAGQSPASGLMAVVAEIATRAGVELVALALICIGLVWAMRQARTAF